MYPFNPIVNKVLRRKLARVTPFSIVFLGTALLASGCVSDPSAIPLHEFPSFQVGYSDGCTTSNEEDKSFSTKSERDAHAFENDDAYRAGWRQGYLECNNRTPDANDGGRILGERNEY